MDYAAILHEVTQPKGKIPVLRPGQTVRVHARIVEGNKERVQVFEGLVIGVSGAGVNKTVTVRKVASGVGVERTWPVFSPTIDKIEVVRQAKVRRAKLNFVRGLTKKQSRLKERFAEVVMEGVEEEKQPESVAEAPEEKVAEENVEAAPTAEQPAEKEAEKEAAPVEEKKEEKAEAPAEPTPEEKKEETPAPEKTEA